MKLRTTEQEPGARPADFNTVFEQLDVRRFRVLASHAQAVGEGFRADAVALQAIACALPHLTGKSGLEYQ